MMLTSLNLVTDTRPECMLSFHLLSIHAEYYVGNTGLILIMVHQHNFEMAWTSVFWLERLYCNDDDYDGGRDHHHHHYHYYYYHYHYYHYYYYCYCYYMQSGLVSREVQLVLEQWPALSRG